MSPLTDLGRRLFSREKLRRARKLLPHLMRGHLGYGHCPICECWTLFVREGEWARDQLRCSRCASVPRWRALIAALETYLPEWRQLVIHESSPDGAASEKIRKECRRYVATHYFPTVPDGIMHQGYRNENLERQTFGEAEFDLVVTQDVLEHVADPQHAFSEIARTLKPGGAHVFTVPWYHWKPTLVRARCADDGSLEHLHPAEYHGNPIDASGALVFTEWGEDFCDLIYKWCGMTTTVIRMEARFRGIEGSFIEVFLSRKSNLSHKL